MADAKNTCLVAGCKRPRQARGVCSMHYQRDPRGLIPPRRVYDNTPCEVEGCERLAKSKGFCGMHYQRLRDGRPMDTPTDLRYQRRTPEAPCSNDECDEMAWVKGQCKKHYTQRKNREYRAANAHKFRDWHLARYGITSADYDRLFESQRGRCASCGDPAREDRKLCVDHDHNCCAATSNACGQCVRGLLCTTCNTGIGAFRDDPERMRRAMEYLARTRGQLFA